MNFSTPAGVNCAPLFCRDKLHQLFGIDAALLAELDAHRVAMAVDGDHAQASGTTGAAPRTPAGYAPAFGGGP